jgi:hypothetical protein
MNRDTILAEALQGALRAPRYRADRDETMRRLAVLYELVLAADIVHATCYGHRLAAERYARGYDLGEVQVAVNALEETIWRQAHEEDDFESLRVATTVLGAAKHALAREYVRLAAAHRAPAVDVEALVRGT